MANHCYNSIIIKGNLEQLKELYKLLIKEEDYLNFKHILNQEILDVNKMVGTNWFAPDVEFQEGSITLSGRSAWSPPIPLFENLTKRFSSLSVNMKFEEFGLGIGGEVEINGERTKELFVGSYWGYKAYKNYLKFVENAKNEVAYYIDDGLVSTKVELQNLEIFSLLKQEDRNEIEKLIA